MSDAPQGPGWWVASDGKYYPPEQAATPPPAPPAVPPPVPDASAPPPSPPAPKQSGGKGCLYAVIALAVLAFLGIMGVLAAVFFVGSKAADTIQDAAEQKECPFLSDEEASDALGQKVDAVELSGFTGLVGIATDNRVLDGSPDCVLFIGDQNTAGRVARFQGSDAAERLAHERDLAVGTSQDQGGGVSLETDAYLSTTPVTVGDEGFCTTSSVLGASGALVRKGDTLVYASVQPASGAVESDEAQQCATAQQLAEKILG